MPAAEGEPPPNRQNAGAGRTAATGTIVRSVAGAAHRGV